MATRRAPKRGAASGCALLLAAAATAPSIEAFSPTPSFLARQRLLRPSLHPSSPRCDALLMAGFPPPMGGPGGPPPPPPMRGPGGPPPPGMGGPGGRSFGADNPLGTNDGPGQQSRDRGGGDAEARGLGALASGVSTPMDKYGNRRPPERPRRPGNNWNVDGPGPGPQGPGPRDRDGFKYNARGTSGYGREEGRMGGGDVRRSGGRPQNLRYEERDYGEYVTNLRSNSPPGPVGRGGDPRELQDEVERLRKENQLLKSSCRDLMNAFNELSNRLFDVDESLKKVAKVFPSEDEMESLEWLLRRQD